MKTVRTLLYVFSALFMLSVVFVFLPWDWLNAFMALFGEYVYPDDSLVQYTVRMMLALAFWIGVLMAAAVYRAENDPLFLLIHPRPGRLAVRGRRQRYQMPCRRRLVEKNNPRRLCRPRSAD